MGMGVARIFQGGGVTAGTPSDRVVCGDIGIVTDALKASFFFIPVINLNHLLVSSSTLYSNKLQTFPEATTIACKT